MAGAAVAFVSLALACGYAFGAAPAWTVDAGEARSTAGDAAIVVACTGDANGMRIAMEGRGWRPGPAEVRVAGGAADPLDLGATIGPDGVATFGDDDEDRLWARLLVADHLVVTLRGDGWLVALPFATDGFVDAFALLGCAPADACPARSCGP